MKFITLSILITFLCQNTALADPGVEPPHPPLTGKIFVPEKYGRIEYPPPGNPHPAEKMVILIKDAHCNYEAQTNISHILDILIRDYKIDLVCVEGASGHVNPSVIAEHCDNAEVRKKVTDKYLGTGLLTASEALSINRGTEPGFTIWGVENLRLYLKDYQAFRNSINTNGETTHFVKLLSNTISRLKKKLYPEKLLRFDEEINKYEINEILLTNFIKFLTLVKPIHAMEYPALDLVIKSIRLEEKIYFGKVEAERSALIKHLEQYLPKEDLGILIKQSLLFKLGKIPQADYYTYLEEYYRSYSTTLASPMENLEKYFQLVRLQVQIDENALFGELEKFQESIYTDLIPGETARQLHQLDKDVKILAKVLNLESPRDDFLYYKNNRHRFTPEKLVQFINIQAPINNITIPPELKDPVFLEKVKTALLPSEEFYNLALGRDHALVENLLNTMEKNKKETAVLIIGGFHTDGIKRILSEKGVSPIIITPSITKAQDDSKELYLARIMDERIDPEMILAKLSLENLQAVVATSPQGIDNGLHLEPIRYAEELRGRLGTPASPDKFLAELPGIIKNYENAGENPSLRASLEKLVIDVVNGFKERGIDINGLKTKLGPFYPLIFPETPDEELPSPEKAGTQETPDTLKEKIGEIKDSIEEAWNDFYLNFDRDKLSDFRATLSGLMNQLVEYCAKLAILELGLEKDARFCLVTLGSLSRGEFPFVSDVEFAIIPENAASGQYAERLEKRIIETLKEIGFYTGYEIMMQNKHRYILDEIIGSWMIKVGAEEMKKAFDETLEREAVKQYGWEAPLPPDPGVFYSSILNANLIELGIEGEDAVFGTLIAQAEEYRKERASGAEPGRKDAIREIREVIEKYLEQEVAGQEISIKEYLNVLQCLLYLLQIQAGVYHSHGYIDAIEKIKAKGLIEETEAERLKEYYETLLDYRLLAQYLRLKELNPDADIPAKFQRKKGMGGPGAPDLINTITAGELGQEGETLLQELREFIQAFIGKRPELIGRPSVPATPKAPGVEPTFGKTDIQELELFSRELLELRHKRPGKKIRLLNLLPSPRPGRGPNVVIRQLRGLEDKIGGLSIEQEIPEIAQEEEFRRITQKIRHAIQGDQEIEISEEEWDYYNGKNREIAYVLDLSVDTLFIHDHKFLAAIPHIKKRNPNLKIIWHCHLDVDNVNHRVWDKLLTYINQADSAILQPRENGEDLYYELGISPKARFAPPAIINPTSDKYRTLSKEEIDSAFEIINSQLLGRQIDRTRPYWLAAGRYDPDKNFAGAINEFVMAREKLKQLGIKDNLPQLVIAGPRFDDRYLEDLRRLASASEDIAKDIFLLDLTDIENNEILINALQAQAYGGIHLSLREGFGLPVAEMMYMGKPVIGSARGGIATQIFDTVTGFLVDIDTGGKAGERIVELTLNQEKAEAIGSRAREYARENFLVTNLARSYLSCLLEVFDSSVSGWSEDNPAVDAEQVYEHIRGRYLVKYNTTLQKELKDARGQREETLQVLDRLPVIHSIIENNLTQNGMASQMVSEKLENIIFSELRQKQKDSEHQIQDIDLACIATSIMSVNSELGYVKANKLKWLLRYSIKDYMRSRKLDDRLMAYKELPGQYYGFSGTRLFVIGLKEEDLRHVIEKIWPECLKETGVTGKEQDKYPIYIGHMKIGIEDGLVKAFQEASESGDYSQVAVLAGNLSENARRKTVALAEAAEKNEDLRREHNYSHLLAQGDSALTEKYRSDIIKRMGKDIPERIHDIDRDGNPTSSHGKTPRISHNINHLNLTLQKVREAVENRSPELPALLDEYYVALNRYFMESLQDIRYRKSFKLDPFKMIGNNWADVAEYIEFLKSLRIGETDSLAALWQYPLKMAKMGDEIWLFFQMAAQIFLELNKFNACNEHYPPDAVDSLYHQILDRIFELYKRQPLESFAERLKEELFTMDLIVANIEPYNQPEGYMPKSMGAKIIDDNGREIIISERPLLDRELRPGDKVKFNQLVFHSSEKTRINGKLKRLKLYELKPKGREPTIFAVYKNRIYTADGKDDEGDWIDRTQEIAGLIGIHGEENVHPVTDTLGVTITTDRHNLLRLRLEAIADLGTYQKKKMKKDIADVSEIIAHQIASILEKHGIEIDTGDLDEVIVDSTNTEQAPVNFMKLWELLHEKEITTDKFFLVMADISDPVNRLLGPRAKNRGARVMGAVLHEILTELPGKEREEIMHETAQRVMEQRKRGAKRRLIDLRVVETIKVIAYRRKGVVPQCMEKLFNLFKQGMDILIMDPGLLDGKIDESYFAIIEQLDKLIEESTHIGQGAIMNAIKKQFGITAERQQGQTIPNSLLWKEAKKLEGYNKPGEGEYPLEEVDETLWDSDFGSPARLIGRGPHGRNRYLSALDVVSKNTGEMITTLRSTPIRNAVESKAEAGVIYHIEEYIKIEEVRDDGSPVFSYKPGVETVFRQMHEGIKIAFTAENIPEEKRELYETALRAMKTGRPGKSIFMAENLEEANKKLKSEGIKQDNIVYVAGKSEAGKQGFKEKIERIIGLKTIVIGPESAFHATLLFAVLYARIEGGVLIKGIVNPEIKTLIWHFLKLMDYDDARINEVIKELRGNNGLYFTVTLKRIEETLDEFRNRRLYISSAA